MQQLVAWSKKGFSYVCKDNGKKEVNKGVEIWKAIILNFIINQKSSK